MEVALIGLHKRFCDEAFFEKVFSHVSHSDFAADDIVLLQTCNRIEIYVSSPFLSERHPELLDLLKKPFGDNVEKRFYTLMGADVLKHLAQVCSGLDSLICGETDIQHQVKKAYEVMGKGLNKDGHFLFQKALHIAKKLRTEFDIKPVRSLVDQVTAHLDPLLKDGDHILFVGNSDLNQKIYSKLKTQKTFHATLVSHHIPDNLSAFYGVECFCYEDLNKLQQYKGVVLATHTRIKTHQFLLEDDGFICDLSRPKVMIQNASVNFDLHFFEEQSSQMALKQYFSRCDAIEYIHSNVRRLLDSRLDKESYQVI